MILFLGRQLFLFCALAVFCSSCLTKIALDLPTEINIVVEGNVFFDRARPSDTLTHFIKITNSQNFFVTQDFKVVMDATVEVKDNDGNVYLFEFVPHQSRYEARFLSIPDNIYTLSITTADGQQYEASDKMPVTIATLTDIELIEYKSPFARLDEYPERLPTVKFLDPSAEVNYYDFALQLNSLTIPDLYRNYRSTPLLSDINFNGDEASYLIRYDFVYHSMDTIVVYLYSLSKEAFIFKEEVSLASSASNSPFGRSAPRPVLGNIQNITDNDKPGLGFFSAISFHSIEVVAE